MRDSHNQKLNYLTIIACTCLLLVYLMKFYSKPSPPSPPISAPVVGLPRPPSITHGRLGHIQPTDELSSSNSQSNFCVHTHMGISIRCCHDFNGGPDSGSLIWRTLFPVAGATLPQKMQDAETGIKTRKEKLGFYSDFPPLLSLWFHPGFCNRSECIAI